MTTHADSESRIDGFLARLRAALRGAHAVMALRLQQERIAAYSEFAGDVHDGSYPGSYELEVDGIALGSQYRLASQSAVEVQG